MDRQRRIDSSYFTCSDGLAQARTTSQRARRPHQRRIRESGFHPCTPLVSAKIYFNHQGVEVPTLNTTTAIKH